MSQEDNAKIIFDYLVGTDGWSKEAAAGILGNMQSESGIVPDIWESGQIGNMNVGYGLVQWTPASKYITWAQNQGLNYKDIYSQLKRIQWEVNNNQQWINANMSFKQFTQRAVSPEDSAFLFIRYYERPLNPNQPARQTQARYWYEKFKNDVISQKKNEVYKMFLFKADIATVYGDQNAVYLLADGVIISIDPGNAFNDMKAAGIPFAVLTKMNTEALIAGHGGVK
ncbi:hypothetical protein ESZ50_07960 [Weissella muntiaci]|uniref:Phage tail lysozyme domain-containing protein n=1 Tax=Weissella muntiaci TaxID=2508881 RepID=A0A6C2C5K9_9LACO|nr:phage tail tip lysozyme [Weissella muntiaci]TYC48803.1 hypothetical protein ESZ50_07960 [Weissella muntiaci]